MCLMCVFACVGFVFPAWTYIFCKKKNIKIKASCSKKVSDSCLEIDERS